MPRETYRYVMLKVFEAGKKKPRNVSNWFAKIAGVVRSECKLAKLPPGEFTEKMVMGMFEAQKDRRARRSCARDSERKAELALFDPSKKNAALATLAADSVKLLIQLIEAAPAYRRVEHKADLSFEVATTRGVTPEIRPHHGWRSALKLIVPVRWWSTVYARGLALVGGHVIIEAGPGTTNVPVKYLLPAFDAAGKSSWTMREGLVTRDAVTGKLSLVADAHRNNVLAAVERMNDAGYDSL
jgi:hypothetical protein